MEVFQIQKWIVKEKPHTPHMKHALNEIEKFADAIANSEEYMGRLETVRNNKAVLLELSGKYPGELATLRNLVVDSSVTVEWSRVVVAIGE